MQPLKLSVVFAGLFVHDVRRTLVRSISRASRIVSYRWPACPFPRLPRGGRNVNAPRLRPRKIARQIQRIPLSGSSRARFRAELDVDSGTWSRGRGWALWKARITLVGHLERDAPDAALARRDIDQIVTGYAQDR